jgi:hypothetical protein
MLCYDVAINSSSGQINKSGRTLQNSELEVFSHPEFQLGLEKIHNNNRQILLKGAFKSNASIIPTIIHHR